MKTFFVQIKCDLGKSYEVASALADAEMAASLLLRLEDELRLRHQVAQVSVALLCRIQRASKAQLPKCLAAARAV